MPHKVEQEVLPLDQAHKEPPRPLVSLQDAEIIRLLAESRLAGEHRQVLDSIWYNNLTGQFEMTMDQIGAITGINHPNISRAINLLYRQGLIVRRKLRAGVYWLEINKDTGAWNFVSKKIKERRRNDLRLSLLIKTRKKRGVIVDTPVDETPPDYQLYIDKWNIFAVANGLVQVKTLTEPRKVALKARLREKMWDMDAIIAMIRQSDFLMGRNDRNWRVDFDFVIHKSKYIKILEGGWSNRPAKPATNQGGYSIP